MIDYDNDAQDMIVYCDGDDCDETLEFSGEFLECISELKASGWHAFKECGDWEHYCPVCWANRGARGVFDGA